MTFWGLRSRCATPWSCINFTASNSCWDVDRRCKDGLFSEVSQPPATGMETTEPPRIGHTRIGRMVWFAGEARLQRYCRISSSLLPLLMNLRYPITTPSRGAKTVAMLGCCAWHTYRHWTKKQPCRTYPESDVPDFISQ